MLRLPFLCLVAFACVLGAVILSEYRGGKRAPSLAGTPTVAGSIPAAAAPPTAVAAKVAAAALDRWSGTILQRPLFSPSRRPGRAAAPSSEAPPRLAGIIIGPDGARAIFAGAGDARAIVAGPGSRAGPYLVRAVDAAGVAVLGPNGPELLRPAYDHGAARDSAGPPAVAAPSILDLLRARVQNGGGLRSALLPSGTAAPGRQFNLNPQR